MSAELNQRWNRLATCTWNTPVSTEGYSYILQPEGTVMIISSDFLHKHRRENCTHFPITHTDDRPKAFIPFTLAGGCFGSATGRCCGAEHPPLALTAAAGFAQSVYAVFVTVGAGGRGWKGLVVHPVHKVGASTLRDFARNTNMLLLSTGRLEVNTGWGVKYWDSCWVDVEDEFTVLGRKDSWRGR